MPYSAMFADLQPVALRHGAVFIPSAFLDKPAAQDLSSHTLYSLSELHKCGFSLSQRALQAFNLLDSDEQGQVLHNIEQEYAVNMNWTPLVRDWQTPTGQTPQDMLYTYVYNVANRLEGDSLPGTRLPCGHVIPDGVFDLSRYTGCPFCGKPFELHPGANFGQGSIKHVLELMTEADMRSLLRNMLEMNTPLDATQIDTLRILLRYFAVPEDVEIKMKETLVAVMYFMIRAGEPEKLLGLVKSPTDVLRYLWFEHTGMDRIIRPRTLLQQTLGAWSHICPAFDDSVSEFEQRKQRLRLHYSRPTGRIAAWLLNTMTMPAEEMCAAMHPHRNIWVHMIRALHLPDFARKKGNGKLRNVLDRFYRGDYLVPQGVVDQARLRNDYRTTMDMLQLRPGAFARQLFSNMLWYAPDIVLDEFRKVITLLPTRLIISLANAAETYFNPDAPRVVTTITGKSKKIEKPALLYSLPVKQLKDTIIEVKGLVLDALRLKYGMMPKGEATYIYIDPVLQKCVLPVGDRSQALQGAGSALPGMSFAVEGDKVRLFLFWGEGMPAQPIDLDLAAMIFYENDVRNCYFGDLTVEGAQHSGDIREIPDLVGTAEYIELDLPALKESGARYVVFSVANYSGGELPPNTRVGWMSSEHPMTVSNETGVAFDPSCVQMMIRLPQNMQSRSMLFGVLDVEAREITYLESFEQMQVVNARGASLVLDLLQKLREKITIGQALHMMAEMQDLTEVTTEDLAADPTLAAKTRIYDTSVLSNLPELLRTLIPE